MAHELATTADGREMMAFRGEVPWHGLGFQILPNDSLDDIRLKAGFDYDVIKTPARYTREFVGITGENEAVLHTSKDFCVLYRSDTGDNLSVVSPKYQVVQPKAIIEFYRDLTEQYGFELETVGALKGGRKVWALANTKNAFQLRGKDDVKGYLLLATSYDGSMATQARFTSVRVVCNNTLTLADRQGKAEVVVPHSTKFDASRVKLDLQVGEAWAAFERDAETMSERVVSRDESLRFMLDVYYGLTNDDEIKAFQADPKNETTAKKFIERMTRAMFEAPGAHLSSAKGMLWGLVNAVTFDVDHTLPSRSQENRLNKAWFGTGEALKRRAWAKAKEMVA